MQTSQCCDVLRINTTKTEPSAQGSIYSIQAPNWFWQSGPTARYAAAISAFNTLQHSATQFICWWTASNERIYPNFREIFWWNKGSARWPCSRFLANRSCWQTFKTVYLIKRCFCLVWVDKRAKQRSGVTDLIPLSQALSLYINKWVIKKKK